ncbi:MAG: MFS transporter [Dehalococcoidia bacterium]|nr:MFS transporter [Dehalococcoidia bacterium]
MDSSHAEVEPDLPDKPIRPWSALLIRDYRLLWGSGLFSSTSAQMRQVANLYQVYAISSSPLQLGLTSLFQALPNVLFGIFGGALADVVDRKKLMLFSQGFNIIPALILGVLTTTGAIQVWHIYVLTAMNSFVGAFGGPAQQAMIPRIVPRTHLLNAVTLNIATQQLTRLFSAVLAGLLIDRIGLGSVYFVTGVLFVVPILAILSLRTSGKPEGASRRVTLPMLWGGFQFIWFQRIILALFLLDFAAVLAGYYQPLLPIFAKDVYKVGATGLGILYAAPAVGAIVGPGLLLLAGNFRRKGAVAVVAALIFGASLALMGASPWFWMTLIAIGLLGLTDAISVAIRRTTVQMLAPDEMQGRASSLITVFAMGTNSLGGLVAGFAAQQMGAPHALMLGSGLCITFVLIIVVAIPQLWRYRSE